MKQQTTSQISNNASAATTEQQTMPDFRSPFPITVPAVWDSRFDDLYHLQNFGETETPYRDARNRIKRNFTRFKDLVDAALVYFGHQELISRRARLENKLRKLAQLVECDQPNSQFSYDMTVFIGIYEETVTEYRRIFFAPPEKKWSLYELGELSQWLYRAWKTLEDDLRSQYKDIGLPD